jgi:hypothetical protein
MLLLTFLISLDIVIGASQGINHDAIEKARIILSDAVMREIIDEDGAYLGEYEKVLRNHIVSGCQHLKICLFTIDSLMILFNENEQKKAVSEGNQK